MKRAPKKRKCRNCWRNFPPAELVTEVAQRDERGYLLPPARWCPPCAADRLAEIIASEDPRCADEIAGLSAAINAFAKRFTS